MSYFVGYIPSIEIVLDPPINPIEIHQIYTPYRIPYLQFNNGWRRLFTINRRHHTTRNETGSNRRRYTTRKALTITTQNNTRFTDAWKQAGTAIRIISPNTRLLHRRPQLLLWLTVSVSPSMSTTAHRVRNVISDDIWNKFNNNDLIFEYIFVHSVAV
jgi:hypothetical protein